MMMMMMMMMIIIIIIIIIVPDVISVIHPVFIIHPSAPLPAPASNAFHDLSFICSIESNEALGIISSPQIIDVTKRGTIILLIQGGGPNAIHDTLLLKIPQYFSIEILLFFWAFSVIFSDPNDNNDYDYKYDYDNDNNNDDYNDEPSRIIAT